MRVVVQIPMCDLRTVTVADTGKLPKPRWPYGRVDPGSAEFVRGFGALSQVTGPSGGSWEGSVQFVDLGKVLSLPSGYESSLDGGHRWRLECRTRRLYGAQGHPRLFAQIEFKIIDRSGGSPGWPEVQEAVDRIATLPVNLKGALSEEGLVRTGPPIGAAYEQATTRRGLPVHGSSIRQGTPLIVVSGQIDDRSSAYAGWDRVDGFTGNVYYKRARYQSAQTDLWILATTPQIASRAVLRSVRHIARFQSERTVLLESMRLLASPTAALPSGAQVDRELVEEAVRRSASFVFRPRKFGNRQEELIDSFRREIEVHGGQWNAFMWDVERIFEAGKVEGTVINVTGDYIGGDKFENIQDSTIVSRSTVSNAFNKLAGSGEAELVEELRGLAELVEAEGNPEAEELFENLVEELSAKKRSASLRSLWRGLVDALPAVASVATAGTKLAELVL